MNTQEGLSIFSRKRVVYTALLCGLLVASYEIVKAIEHTAYVGFSKDLDIKITGFWVLDVLVSAIVAFILVWISFSFERMEKHLEHYSTVAKDLSNEFESSKSEIKSLKKDLNNVVGSVAAEGMILSKLHSQELISILQNNLNLQNSFYSNIHELTNVWVKLLVNEDSLHQNNPTMKKIALDCWGVMIDTYLKEEVIDIEKRIVATNLGVYLKLIENLTDSVILSSELNQNCEIELYATANILPKDYFNWKEVKSHDAVNSFSDINNEFMDNYRCKMQEWLKNKNRLRLKRVILVQDSGDEDDHELELKLNSIGILKQVELRNQAVLKILCDIKTGAPRIFNISELKKIVDIDSVFANLYSSKKAYGINANFKLNESKLATQGLKSQNLLQYFIEELHSKPFDDYSLFLTLNQENSHLIKYLPTLPSEKSVGVISCPDFLALRIKENGNYHTLACIAAQLKPNHETMLLQLITDPKELEDITNFIVESARYTKPLKEILN